MPLRDKLPMRDYQVDALNFAQTRSGANLFMEPGLGKTRISLESIAETDGRALVVAPLLVAKNTWPQENKKWGFDFDMRLLHGKDFHLDKLPTVSTINYEGLLKLREMLRDVKEFPWSQIIYDECSKMKHPGSRRYKMWRSTMGKFEFRTGLTGTPIGARVEDLFGEQFIVDLGQTLGRQKEYFLQKYFIPRVRGKRIEWEPMPGALDDIIQKMKPTAKSYTTDLLDMPPLTFNPIHLPFPKKIRDMYEEMKHESTVEDMDMVAANAGVRSNKLRQMASGSVYDMEGAVHKLHNKKLDALKNLIEELNGNRLLTAFEFKHDIEAIASIIAPGDLGILDGSTKPKDDDKIIDRWNDGALANLAIHPVSAGYGLNLQGSANHICLYTMPWSFEYLRQIIGRLWRQGQEKPVVVHALLVDESKDIEVWDTALERWGTHSELMEGLSG